MNKQNLKKSDYEPPKQEVEVKVQPKREYRYVCFGCTANAGWFDTPAPNLRIICPRCGKDQLSELQHFIYDPK
jgi:hypothetical protein